MKFKGRVDKNQSVIVEQLRNKGYSVAITSPIGNGFPDIVVGHGNFNFMFEIKNPCAPSYAQKLTYHEDLFKNKWRGQYDIIYNTNDAIKIMEKKMVIIHKQEELMNQEIDMHEIVDKIIDELDETVDSEYDED